jgi:uncharacterized protein
MLIRKPLQTVVVKTVASLCNLKCDYCFYLNKSLKYHDEKVMDDETLKEFIRQMTEQTGNSFGVVWQGGEPSLAGAEFFRKAIAMMQKYGEGKNKVISNLLQTNGYSLSDDLINVLSEFSFLCGLSLDGPEDIHNTYRKTASGKGSWQKVMSTWRKLQNKQIATNILCCVTSLSATNAENIYLFFKFHRMDWLQFIPVTEYAEDDQPTPYSISPTAWGMFMCKIFDLWHDDFINNRQAPSIRFIENAFHARMGLGSPECTFMDECGNYLVLEYNGDVFSCDYLVGVETKLGNIHSDNMIEMLNSDQQLSFGKAKQKMHDDCKNCRWLPYCYGGCPKYRYEPTRKYYFCESWQMFLKHSDDRLQAIAATYRKNNPSASSNTLDVSGYFY